MDDRNLVRNLVGGGIEVDDRNVGMGGDFVVELRPGDGRPDRRMLGRRVVLRGLGDLEQMNATLAKKRKHYLDPRDGLISKMETRMAKSMGELP